MKTKSTLSRLAIAAAFSVCATSALAGGAPPPVDGYLCQKAKDLKDPAAIVTAPVIANVLTILSINDCTVGKLAQFCVPASETGSTINAGFVAQCCFKVKCAEEPEVPFTVTDTGNGSPTFSGSILSGRKDRTLCIPCNMQPPA